MQDRTSSMLGMIRRLRMLREAYPTLVPKSKEEAETWVKQWREMGSEYVEVSEIPYDSWFDGKARVYLPIDEVEVADEIDPPDGLDDVLEKYGFEIHDLDKGLARSLDPKNAKNTYGIGKILARYTKDAQKSGDTSAMEKAKNLVDDFAKFLADKKNQEKIEPVITDEKHLVVISRDPLDILKMSTDKGWWSCTKLDPDNPYNSHHNPAFVLRAGLIAFKIEKDDVDIKDPESRVLLLPYKKKNGGVFLGIAHHEYSKEAGGCTSLTHDFKNVIQRWLDSKQGDLDEVVTAPYLGYTGDKSNKDLILYGDGNPETLSPNNPRLPGVVDQTLKQGNGASLVAEWLAQGKIRPTTELLLKMDGNGNYVAERYASKGKRIRNPEILKLTFIGGRGSTTSVLALALQSARDTDIPRYLEVISSNPDMLGLPTGIAGANKVIDLIVSPAYRVSQHLGKDFIAIISREAEDKYPHVFSEMILNGLVPPPSESWYSQKGEGGEANIFTLLSKASPQQVGDVPLSVFSSRFLKAEDRRGVSLAQVLLQYMLKNRIVIQNLPSVKAIKEIVTSDTTAMSLPAKFPQGTEPLVCWWAKNRKVFWTNDLKLLSLRSSVQGGKTLAHILAENNEKNKWIPADRKVLNWMYGEGGKDISVRDILISKGVTRGIGTVEQPRKRVGGIQGADDMAESRSRRSR